MPAAAPNVVVHEADRPAPPAQFEEILLEPGAARPQPRPSAGPTEVRAEGNSRELRANLIAAARRAAQAAEAEVAANGKGKGGRVPDAVAAVGAAGGTFASRLQQIIDKRRRPILLGLAAIVLALGAWQTLGGLRGGSDTTTAAAPTKIEIPAPIEANPGAPAVEEPKTTQAIPGASLAAPERGDAATTTAAPASDPAPAHAASAPPAKVEPKLPVFMAPPDVPASLQIPPALPAPAGASDQRASLPKIANVAAAAEIPASIGVPGLRQAALAGDPLAVYDLAARAAEGRGVPRDLKLAAKLFEKAAAHGLVPAQYRIGNHYEKGLGATRDLALAKAWYQRAAEKGNARAMHNLAVLLAEGGGDKPEYAGAAEWFRRAAEHGVRDSQFNLAVLYGRGLGVAQDLSKSYKWFAIAAAHGDEDAGKKRDEVAARMTSSEVAAARAAAERWRAEPTDRAANEVTLPAQGWTDTSASAPAPARAANAGKRALERPRSLPRGLLIGKRRSPARIYRSGATITTRAVWGCPESVGLIPRGWGREG